MSEKEVQGKLSSQQGPISAKEASEDFQEGIEARLEEIREYLKTESKTEKDAERLNARLTLTAEERSLTSEENEYKANLRGEQRRSLESLGVIERDLRKIKVALDVDCAEEGHVKNLKECQKRTAKYLSEVEKRMQEIAAEIEVGI